jgi:hypothetical protein
MMKLPTIVSDNNTMMSIIHRLTKHVYWFTAREADLMIDSLV